VQETVLLTTHHVGGREGHGPFLLPGALAVDAPIVFYEADPDAVEGMTSKTRPTAAIAKCVGRARERTTFNITHKPHASSLRLLDRRFADAYFHKTTEEPVWGITFRIARTIEIETDSLDAIVGSGEFSVNPPDVLTLDTEGTEYEILEGAGALLQKEIVCVVAEVAFLPIRQGQKLYGDVAALLARRGFVPVQLQHHAQEMSLFRAPVGLRGRGLQAFADAVFLKDPKSALADWQSVDAAVKLRKLALAALVFGQLEYALDCLKRARQIGLPRLAAPPRYWIFLDALEQCAARVEPRFLAVPGDISVSAAARNGAVVASGVKQQMKRYLANRPGFRAMILREIDKARRGRRRLEYLGRKYLGARSPVERLLADHGFVALSDRVRDLRLLQSPWVATRAPYRETGASPGLGNSMSDRSTT
jgi:FkbM family methyltransferase